MTNENITEPHNNVNREPYKYAQDPLKEREANPTTGPSRVPALPHLGGYRHVLVKLWGRCRNVA
jgi:hypothetical protein